MSVSEGVNWRCPFCAQFTTVTKSERFTQVVLSRVKTKLGRKALKVEFTACSNPDCTELCIEAELSGYDRRSDGEIDLHFPDNSWKLRPQGTVRQFPDYVPTAILADYREACLILELSPKASATLSRRCLQGMIRHVWGVRPGRLVDEIQAIRKDVDNASWQAIDAVRQLGNVGAHMEKDIDVIVDVDPGEAELLVQLVETLIVEWYVNREESRRRMASVVAAAASKKSPRNLSQPIAREPEQSSQVIAPAPDGVPVE